MKYRLRLASFILPLLIGGLMWFATNNFSIGVAIFAMLLMPALIGVYIPYAKDNPEHLWFKRKIYGWGWTPVSWQGWLVTVLYVGLVALFALTIDESSPPQEIAFTFVLPATFLTIALIHIAYKKGEKPRWQWGVDGK